MADNPPADNDDDRLAKAFAKGLSMYEADRAEREAKANAGNEGGNDSDNDPPKPGLRDRLLGWI